MVNTMVFYGEVYGFMKPFCSLAQPVAVVFLDLPCATATATWGAAPAADRRTTAESILGECVVQDTPIGWWWYGILWDYTFFVLLNISGIIVSHVLKLLILIHADLVICWNTIWVTLSFFSSRFPYFTTVFLSFEKHHLKTNQLGHVWQTMIPIPEEADRHRIAVQPRRLAVPWCQWRIFEIRVESKVPVSTMQLHVRTHTYIYIDI